VASNQLLPYYKKLRSEHPIDYEALASTAKNIKTLSDDFRKTAISYFRKIDDDSSDDSYSSNDNKNLIDQMREKISQIDCQQGMYDRSALKKRWWTNE
jgi:hypothetical protein